MKEDVMCTEDSMNLNFVYFKFLIWENDKISLELRKYNNTRWLLMCKTCYFWKFRSNYWISLWKTQPGSKGQTKIAAGSL